MRLPFWRRKQREDDLEEEILRHLQMAIRDRIERGETAEQAEAAARREFGNLNLVKETTRDMWGLRSIEILFQDIRYGARMLRRYPAFTAVIVLSVALGIGANTAIFSVVNALLFKPLPYLEPNRLMALVQPDHKAGAKGDYLFWSYPAFAAVRDENKSFENVAAYSDYSATLSIEDQPEKGRGEIVTASYFPTLGVNAAIGRIFLPEEDRTPGAYPIVILSYSLWQRRFGSDPTAVGKIVYINKAPFTVVGVLPAGFRGQSGAADFWAPMMMAEQLRWSQVLSTKGSVWLKIIARLKPGTSLEQARSEMPVLAQKVTALAPSPVFSEPAKWEFKVVRLKETKIDPAVARAFLVLLASVICVLLIACANTANLLLARAVGRQKEFAVRAALGAGRGRLIRQVLTESILLSLLGGVGGLVIGLLGINWLTSAKPWNSSGPLAQYALTFEYFSVELDWRVLAFNFAIALATGIVFGLAPALQSGRSDVGEGLKHGAGGGITSLCSLRRPGLRSVLVVAEVALSLVLLTCAGLMIKSVAQLSAVKVGFEPRNVVTMGIGSGEQRTPFYRSLLEKVAALPGVQSASFSENTPLRGGQSSTGIEIEGQGASAGKGPAGANSGTGGSLRTPQNEVSAAFVGNGSSVGINIITDGYLKTLGISIIKGRGFGPHDTEDAPHVALINQAMAERFWPGEEPLGRRIKTPLRFTRKIADDWIEIVGIVDDVKYGAIEESVAPTYYLPAGQPTMTADELSIRSSADLSSLVSAVRREVATLDSSVPIYGITTMSDQVAKATSRYRYSALLMGLFAGLALLLAAVGVYGVIGYAVSARTKELGIRIALGARPGQIGRLIITDGAILTMVGLSLGLAASFATTRILTSELYQVKATDPFTFATMVLVLAAVAVMASYLPARRAMRVDPMVALRCE